MGRLPSSLQLSEAIHMEMAMLTSPTSIFSLPFLCPKSQLGHFIKCFVFNMFLPNFYSTEKRLSGKSSFFLGSYLLSCSPPVRRRREGKAAVY